LIDDFGVERFGAGTDAERGEGEEAKFHGGRVYVAGRGVQPLRGKRARVAGNFVGKRAAPAFRPERARRNRRRACYRRFVRQTAVDGSARDKDVVAVALPATQGKHAIETKIVRPFTEVVPAKEIADDLAELGSPVLAMGQVEGRQVFLPRMRVLDVAVYRVSK